VRRDLICVFGDWRSGTGPAIATAGFLEGLVDATAIPCDERGRPSLRELLPTLRRSDSLIVSGFGRRGLIALVAGRLLRRRAIYLLHGCVADEDEANGRVGAWRRRLEWCILRAANGVVIVSPSYEARVLERYRWLEGRTRVAALGLRPLAASWHGNKQVGRDRPYRVISTGGSLPIKRNAATAEVLAELPFPVEYWVVGVAGADERRLALHSFVRRVPLMDQRTLWAVIADCDLCVQWSAMESFGLAVCEAAQLGIPLVLSDSVGCLDICIPRDSVGVVPSDACKDELRDAIVRALGADAARPDLNPRSWTDAAADLKSGVKSLGGRRRGL